jgi:transcription-repair coupling factor (superfamily II helicase)
LQALSNIHSLGAGFALASQDLDIRGAGNLLGDEQSGQIKEVGYELYQQMLEEAVKRIRDGGTSNTILYDDAWSPEINLNVTVLIPKYYVPDINVRLELYRRLSKAGSITEIEDFAKELFDRFGKLPNEVNMLINVMKIKKKCFDAGIVKFDAGPRGVVIKFFRDRFSNPQRLIDYIFSHKDSVKVQGTKLTIKRNWENVKDRVLGSYSIASELARHASK